MSRRLAVFLMAAVSLAWTGWTILLYVGQTLGECHGDASCFAVRDLNIAVLGWRWLAVQLGLILLFLIILRSRKR